MPLFSLFWQQVLYSLHRTPRVRRGGMWLFYALFLTSGLQAQASPIDSLENVLHNTHNDTARFKVLCNLAFLLENSHPVRATQLAEEAYEIAKKINNIRYQATSLRILGSSYVIQGEVLKGIEFQQKSLTLARKANDSINIANTLQSLAGAYNSRSQYPQALEACLEALSICENLNDQNAISGILNNIGIIYMDQQKYKESKEYFQKALGLFEEIKNLKGVASACNNLGTIALNMNQYPDAKRYFQRSLKIKQSLGELRGIANSLGNMGEVLRLEGKADSAMLFYQQALMIFTQIKDASGIAQSLVNHAEVYKTKKQFNQAINYAIQADSVAIGLGNYTVLVDANSLLAELYEATNRPGDALKTYKKYIQYRDSVINEESTIKFKELEFSYTLEKKDQEHKFLKEKNEALEFRSKLMIIIGFLLIIGLLAASFFSWQLYNRRKIIETQRDDLTRLNALKDRFIGIIAHDLRSPLASFESVADGLSYLIAQNQPERIEGMLSHLSETADRFRRLLENLLRWALIQQKGQFPFEPGPVHVADTVNETLAVLEGRQLAKRIQIETDVSTDLVWHADPDAFASIIRNLVDNALKFAPQGSTIAIISEVISNVLFITVKNQVIGPPPKPEEAFKLTKITRKTGTAGEKGTGLGLILCQELAELHGGSLKITIQEQQVNITASFPKRF